MTNSAHVYDATEFPGGVCSKCQTRFQDGDVYALVPALEVRDLIAIAYEAIAESCAVLNRSSFVLCLGCVEGL